MAPSVPEIGSTSKLSMLPTVKPVSIGGASDIHELGAIGSDGDGKDVVAKI